MSEAKAGLLTKGAAVPLEGVSISAEVRDCLASVVVSQRYANREAQPVEAVYVFPLDERAAVCGFEAVVGGAHVVGEVKEREQAFAEYDDALAAGHGAYLLDEERPDVFTASIGNVEPGQEVLVRIRYVTELDATADEVRFVLPTTVSPRYAPAEDRKGVGRTPAEAVNPPLAWSVPYGLELDLSLEMPSDIRAVESPTHPLSVEVEGRRARVRLGERLTALDRDLMVAARLREPLTAPRVVVERGKGGRTAVALTFVPGFEASAESPSEVVFVVDRAGLRPDSREPGHIPAERGLN